MPLDPRLQIIVEFAAALRVEGQSVDDVRAVMAQQHRPLDMTGLASVHDIEVGGGLGPLPARVYRPEGASAGGPVIVFFHGGGWLFGSVEGHDLIAGGIAVDTGVTVISVGYRLAPEHKFPAGVEDCCAAVAWVAAHAGELGVDGSRLAVAGDSAGGNLAAVVALVARDRGGPEIAFQLLLFPATDFSFDHPSHRELGELGYIITTSDLRWYREQYLDEGQEVDWRASPLRAQNLSGLPPAFVVTGELDPLRDEGEAYGRRLRDAGVPATVVRGQGLIHGVLYGLPLEQAVTIRQQIATAARSELGPTSSTSRVHRVRDRE